jgi:type IV pilus assembly protein PilP
VLALALGMLAGCDSGADLVDLQAYMDEVRARPKGSIEPTPSFAPYEAFTYNVASMRHPFQKQVKSEAAERIRSDRNVRPDEARIRQFLEDFNIETFTMVGTMADSAGTYALVSGADGVHRVRLGDYLGRNHGRIVGIGEAEINVLEIVPDGEGGWLERPRSLVLKESSWVGTRR